MNANGMPPGTNPIQTEKKQTRPQSKRILTDCRSGMTNIQSGQSVNSPRPMRVGRSMSAVNSLSNVAPLLLVLAAFGAEAFLLWKQGTISLVESGAIHGGVVVALACASVIGFRRQRVAHCITSSLAAFSRGQRSLDALRVAEDHGPIAQVYNRILDERDEIALSELEDAIVDDEEQSETASGEAQTAIDGMWHGLALFDAQGRLIVANGALSILLGLVREQPLGTPFDRLFSDSSIIEALERVIRKKDRKRLTFTVERGENEALTVLRVSVKPSGDTDAVLIVEDITQQHAADEARLNMVAHTTHELRTPLSNIRLYVEETLDGPEGDQELRSRCLNIVNQEARRLERMVEDMLSTSEIESGSLKLRTDDVRLDAAFRELREDYEGAAQDKGIGISFDLPPKIPVIQGDRQKLAVAMHNLIGNAIKYTPAGGAVNISVREEGGMLVFEVADTGIGISAAEADRIFDRFYRANDPLVSEETGTGLGLTLAREVARLHGGDITVESEQGSGSRFILTIPLPDQLAQAA